MNRKQTLTVAAAALSGMLAGTAARAAVPASTGTQVTTASAGHVVMSMDDTKHDCKGQNACKGQGGCKTSDKGCKGLNSCKGNGGCKTNAPTTAPGL